MKKLAIVLWLCVCVLCLSSCSNMGGADSYLEIADGVKLGMTLKEAVETSEKNGNPINEQNIVETTIAGQPYSLAYYGFCDGGVDSYDSTVVKDENVWGLMVMDDIGLTFGLTDMQYGYNGPKRVTDENKDQVLVQVCAHFTSDSKYGTASETFDAVEKYLTEKYGDTRYTYRRGQSLPLVKGYNGLSVVITKDNWLYKDDTHTEKEVFSEMQDYSQRVIKVDDNTNMVIDHHIYISLKSNEFTHRIIYTLVPKNP